MDKNNKTILLASDHNGNEARKALFGVLHVHGYAVVDMGPFDHSIKVDYTVYAQHLANAISMNSDLCGILICGTGIGMSIVANRFSGVRASLVHDVDEAMKTREHNDSNVLVFGSWKNTEQDMIEMTFAWLNEKFGEGRHSPRVAKIDRPKDVIVVVPGVFELLHSGHIALLEYAKSLGRVVVALNSDKSAEKVKTRRPTRCYEDRKNVLNRIDLVDEIICLDEDRPGNLIKNIGASYVVKGNNSILDYPFMIRAVDNIPDFCEVKLFDIKGMTSKQIRDSLKCQ